MTEELDRYCLACDHDMGWHDALGLCHACCAEADETFPGGLQGALMDPCWQPEEEEA